MPCFKGIAVSVHAEGSPIAEYGVQKHTRMSRVATYIPVPKPKLPASSSLDLPEPAKFAISITLLTPGLPLPYSKPKATPSNPNPTPQLVGGLPGTNRYNEGTIGPYIPITKSENETIAAYIYFDGRPKEEVATLLRPGEETWVNSRWVQVPDKEGGGLAEREFLFREVGLDRWLNGLDLEGEDVAAKIEKRRQKFEKRSRRKKENAASDDDLADMMSSTRKTPSSRSVLRYGEDSAAPVEKLSGDEEEFSSDSDDDAPPEVAGQIKVAMFRVLASGEIKRGEYSPQFDANDDDDENGGKGGDGDVDHTTSFAKPKTLDPKSISTQTVTGIDGPDKPFAVFTFFYRGERQLHKMGLIPSKQSGKNPLTGSAKASSRHVDFGTLNPLKTTGTVGFSTFRDNDISTKTTKVRKSSNGDLTGNAMVDVDSEDDDDDDALVKMEEVEEKDAKDAKALLSPEDARRQGELAEGVGRIKLKRQHSAEPLSSAARKSPASTGTDSPSNNSPPPAETDNTSKPPTLASSVFGAGLPDDTAVIGSPLKKHRASLMDSEGMSKRLAGFTSMGDVVSAAEQAHQTQHAQLPEPAMKDEEL